MINVYLRLAYPREDGCEEVVYSNLASNTLNYMIETDDTLKVPTHLPRTSSGFVMLKYLLPEVTLGLNLMSSFLQLKLTMIRKKNALETNCSQLHTAKRKNLKIASDLEKRS